VAVSAARDSSSANFVASSDFCLCSSAIRLSS